MTEDEKTKIRQLEEELQSQKQQNETQRDEINRLTTVIDQLNANLEKFQQNFEEQKRQNSEIMNCNRALMTKLNITSIESDLCSANSDVKANSAVQKSQKRALSRLSQVERKAKLQKTDENVVPGDKNVDQKESANDTTITEAAANVNNNQETAETNDDDDMSGIDDNDQSFVGGWTTVTYKQKVINKTKPIQVTIGENGFTALNALLGRQIGGANYIANHMRVGKTVRISPKNDVVAKQIEKLLAERGYNFHSYQNKENRNKCFILKGLNEYNDVDSIQQALISAGLPANTLVEPFTTGFQRANPEIVHNRMFKVVVDSKFDEKILNDISGLFNTKISFERMKKVNVVQCKRCQQYFHTAAGCNHQYRCVKCNAQHRPGECPRTINPELPVKCVNCGGSHTANNYRECDFYKEKIAPIVNKKINQNNKKADDYAKTINSAFRGRAQHNNKSSKIPEKGKSKNVNKKVSTSENRNSKKGESQEKTSNLEAKMMTMFEKQNSLLQLLVERLTPGTSTRV